MGKLKSFLYIFTKLLSDRHQNKLVVLEKEIFFRIYLIYLAFFLSQNLLAYWKLKITVSDENPPTGDKKY